MTFGTQVLERTFRIFDYFSWETPELTGPELLARSGLPRSTGYRLLGFLVEQGYLFYDPAMKVYRPGTRFLYLGGLAAGSIDLRQIAVPIMRQLRNDTGESVSLSVVQGNHRVCIEKVESSHDLREFVAVGRIFPLWVGASGKCLLAFMRREEVDSVASSAIESGAVMDIAKLMSDLEQIRHRGWAATFGERVSGAAAVAAPIRDHTGIAIAALAALGPEARFTQHQRMAEMTLAAANWISKSLGYRV